MIGYYNEFVLCGIPDTVHAIITHGWDCVLTKMWQEHQITLHTDT